MRPFLLEPVVKKGIVVIHLDDGSNERDDYDGGNGNKEDENEKRVNGLNKNKEEQDNQERDNEVEVCTDDEERNADEDNNEDSNEERDGDDRRNGEDGAYMFFYINSLLNRARDMTLRCSRTCRTSEEVLC